MNLEQLKDLHEQVKWARHNGGRVTVEVEVLDALLPELPKEEPSEPATASEPTATPEPAATPAAAPSHPEGNGGPASEHHDPSQAAEQK